MHRIGLAILIGFCSTAIVWSQQGNPAEEAIKQTALNYVEGWYDADPARMERALHPDLAKRVLMPDARGKGKVEHMSALTLVQATRARAGKPTPKEERTANVRVFDIYGNTASVRVDMHEWIDYLHVVKIGGEWKIVNVLWELTPEAKKKSGIKEEL